MTEVNPELVLVIIVVALIVFAGAGIFLGTRISSDKRRIKELEDELNDTKKDLDNYRGKVNSHFKKTSDLFSKMTDSYRAVYLHLAEGSQELCTSDAALLKPGNNEFLKVAHEESKKDTETHISDQGEEAGEQDRKTDQPAQPEVKTNTALEKETAENLAGQESNPVNVDLKEFIEGDTSGEAKPEEKSGVKVEELHSNRPLNHQG